MMERGMTEWGGMGWCRASGGARQTGNWPAVGQEVGDMEMVLAAGVAWAGNGVVMG